MSPTYFGVAHGLQVTLDLLDFVHWYRRDWGILSQIHVDAHHGSLLRKVTLGQYLLPLWVDVQCVQQRRED